ncbi:hypothetical protein RJT34_25208 [Clitoria ternatea]|uniref:Uncharacterized protein n=1 Tax=Clitoria ternatea TaxID=43366 RepID=A0AAN9FS38_CLITE
MHTEVKRDVASKSNHVSSSLSGFNPLRFCGGSDQKVTKFFSFSSSLWRGTAFVAPSAKCRYYFVPLLLVFNGFCFGANGRGSDGKALLRVTKIVLNLVPTGPVYLYNKRDHILTEVSSARFTTVMGLIRRIHASLEALKIAISVSKK